ncbi:MAG: hypothetical protein Q6K99_03850 [Thermostichales cyanobacterium BF4_bins_65]
MEFEPAPYLAFFNQERVMEADTPSNFAFDEDGQRINDLFSRAVDASKTLASRTLESGNPPAQKAKAKLSRDPSSLKMGMIDLPRDTVTQPTAAMRQVLAAATVGAALSVQAPEAYVADDTAGSPGPGPGPVTLPKLQGIPETNILLVEALRQPLWERGLAILVTGAT